MNLYSVLTDAVVTVVFLLGLLRDTTGTFKLPLIVAGCSEILGALICFPSVRAKKGEQDCTPACEDESAVA